MYSNIKIFLDFFLSLIGILITLPIYLIIYCLIKYESPFESVIYKGLRTAKGGGTFRLLKFRTMIIDAEKKGGFSSALDDPRFTKVGRFLRKYKLDELPQFFNVLKGDMSLVGPRPQVKYYTDKYDKHEKLILTVRPGITDISSLVFSDMDSILGSNDVDNIYETQIEPLKNKLRIQYVEKLSLQTDLSILFVTLLVLLGFKKKKVQLFLKSLIPGLEL